jgi:hypothetical protein
MMLRSLKHSSRTSRKYGYGSICKVAAAARGLLEDRFYQIDKSWWYSTPPEKALPMKIMHTALAHMYKYYLARDLLDRTGKCYRVGAVLLQNKFVHLYDWLVHLCTSYEP